MTIIDADMHLRDDEGELRKFLAEPFNRRARLLFPRENFDRSLGGALGRQDVNNKIQLEDMDAEHIETAILYPTNGLFIGEVREKEFSVALCQAYNDWVADYCRLDPHRLKAVAIVPVQDPDAAARELERAVGLGLVGAMIPTYCRVGPRNPGDRWMDPIYAAAQNLKVPVAMHATGGLNPSNDRFATFLQVHVFSHVPEQMAAVTGVLLGGVLERFPKLSIGFMEAGCGWIPFWLEHMDEEYELRRSEAPELKAKPSEYVQHGSVYFGVEPEERAIPQIAALIGEDRLLYASDYPHWDSEWPNTTKTILDRSDLSEGLKQKLLGDNARKFYGLDAS